LCGDMTRSEDPAVSTLAKALRRRTTSVADALAPGGLPRTDGFYAWWARNDALPTVPVYPHPREATRLLYVGIAPGRDPVKCKPGSRSSTLRSRINDQHIDGNTGSSTLKLVLAAFLMDERGYRPERRSKKTVLNHEDRLDLRAWQEAQLR
jgi:hypothetical protein